MLAALITVADLAARGIDTSDATRTAALIDSASAAVREAAGDVIAPQVDSTIHLTGTEDNWLTLPVTTVRSVGAVAIDDEPIDDWRLRGGRLWRAYGWSAAWADTRHGARWVPGYRSDITVTLTHGMSATPADVVDLTCSLVAAGMAASNGLGGGSSYDSRRGISSERVDDYQISFTRGADEVVSPMILPEATRAWLRQRFGGGTYTTGYVS